MTKPTPLQLVLGLTYLVVVVFTFYSLIITDKDYALPLLLVCVVGSIALLISALRARPWLAGVVLLLALALAWGMARFYFDGPR